MSSKLVDFERDPVAIFGISARVSTEEYGKTKFSEKSGIVSGKIFRAIHVEIIGDSCI